MKLLPSLVGLSILIYEITAENSTQPLHYRKEDNLFFRDSPSRLESHRRELEVSYGAVEEHTTRPVDPCYG